jgi:hypothetical protein
MGVQCAYLQKTNTVTIEHSPVDEDYDSNLSLDCMDDEQIKAECFNLWNLRSTFEDGGAASDSDDDDHCGALPPPRRLPSASDAGDAATTSAQRRTAISVDEPEPVSGATSYTTSFESTSTNEHRPATDSGTVTAMYVRRPSQFLEPPKLTLEAKRQKYRLRAGCAVYI